MVESQEINISEMSSVIRKRFVVFLALFTIVFATTVIVTLLMPPTYKSSAKLIIQNEFSLYPAGMLPTTAEDKVFLNTQKEIISSSPIISKALNDLAGSGYIKKEKASFDEFKDRISIEYLNESNVLEVCAYLEGPVAAAKLADSVIKEFMDYHVYSTRELADSSLEALTKETISLNGEIDKLKAELKSFADKEELSFYQAKIPYYVNNILDLEKRAKSNDADIMRMKTELEKTKMALNNSPSQLYYPSSLTLYGPNTGQTPTSSLASIPWMQDIKKKLAESQANLSRLTGEFTENHPAVLGVRNEISSLQDSLEKDLKRVLATYTDYYTGYIQFLEAQKNSDEQEKKKCETELEAIASNMNMASSKQIEYNALLKKFEIIQDIYGQSIKKQSDLTLLKERSLGLPLPNIRILQDATVPIRPLRPNLPLNLSFGFCLGIFIGVIGSLSEERKESFKHRNQAPPVLIKNERRAMIRVQQEFVLWYRALQLKASLKKQAVSANISATGINFRIREQLPEDTELEIEIHINSKDVIFATARVIWVAAFSVQGMFDVGAHFVRISPQEREKLINYLYGEHYLSKR